jgi:protein-tyrosine-phosphatase/predicted ATP-grasp superfamily ATP-dependent carboligase
MSASGRQRSGKVLVLGRDTRAFLAVVRSLGRRGLEVHVGWCDPRAPAARSRYVATIHGIPAASPGNGAWRERMLDILERERFDLVIPCSDPAILPLQRDRAHFAPFLGSIYLLDDVAFKIAFDKLESYEFAASLGIAVPRRVRVSGPQDIASALASFSLPVFVKPRASFTLDALGSRHLVRAARTPQELEALVEALLPWGDVAIEERVGGRGEGVEVLAHEGQVLVAFQHVRVHEPPAGGGSSYRRSAALDPELLAATRAFLAALHYTGVAMMEFKVDRARGTWAFIEINARFWGSLPLALVAGVDFPYYLYQMWVEGRRGFPQEYPTGVHCRNLRKDLTWIGSTWRARRHDPHLSGLARWRIGADLGRLVTLREHWDTFVRDDPWPGFAEVSNAARRAARTVGARATALVLGRPWLRRGREQRARRALRQARRLLFVCKGNICRSPFAQRVAERLAPPGLQVASCGYHPQSGRACPSDAVHAAAEMGIDLRGHRSQVLSARMLQDADVILVFDDENYRTLRERWGWATHKVHFLGILGEAPTTIIHDPDGRGPADFRAVYETIRRCVISALRSVPRTAGDSPAREEASVAPARHASAS